VLYQGSVYSTALLDEPSLQWIRSANRWPCLVNFFQGIVIVTKCYKENGLSVKTTNPIQTFRIDSYSVEYVNNAGKFDTLRSPSCNSERRNTNIDIVLQMDCFCELYMDAHRVKHIDSFQPFLTMVRNDQQE
jgi:hypothetical protein